jgi:hypothetical protein
MISSADLGSTVSIILSGFLRNGLPLDSFAQAGLTAAMFIPHATTSISQTSFAQLAYFGQRCAWCDI